MQIGTLKEYHDDPHQVYRNCMVIVDDKTGEEHLILDDDDYIAAVTSMTNDDDCGTGKIYEKTVPVTESMWIKNA